LGPFAAFLGIIAAQGAIIYLLARRLNKIDPDLSTRDYFLRLAQTHGAMGLLLTDSPLKRNVTANRSTRHFFIVSQLRSPHTRLGDPLDPVRVHLP
jgi:hypothetical protein